eukprot:2638632-Pyramimonas_sp.AAC.1
MAEASWRVMSEGVSSAGEMQSAWNEGDEGDPSARFGIRVISARSASGSTSGATARVLDGPSSLPSPLDLAAAVDAASAGV